MYKSSREIDSVSPISQKARTKGEETRERIFQLALEYFNHHGIEYVGIRELARELGLSPGNVSYYFPTKDDIVIEITKRLSTENTRLFQEVEEDLTLTSFIELFSSAFKNHYQYRCIFVSFVHLMKHYQAMGEGYAAIQQSRRAALTKDLMELAGSGFLKRDLTKKDAQYLTLIISHLARFWIQEAEVLLKPYPIEQVMQHYTGLIALTLRPYATAKGRAQLAPFTKYVIEKF